MKLYLLSALAIFGLIASCSNAKELEPDVNTAPQEKILNGIIVTDMSTYGSDPLSILNVVVDKNLMSVTVKYSGGCKAHEFELMGLKMISKALPAQRSLKLFHRADNDDCRELIEETLIFDISVFAMGSDAISLRLDGWTPAISYIPVL